MKKVFSEIKEGLETKESAVALDIKSDEDAVDALEKLGEYLVRSSEYLRKGKYKDVLRVVEDISDAIRDPISYLRLKLRG